MFKLTAKDYQEKLIVLQEESKTLNKRKKIDRLRNQEITAEFYKIKDEWRKNLGVTIAI